MNLIEFISQPWPWYVSGLLLGLVLFLLLFEGKNFGMSANLRTMCSIGGAGKIADFFKFDWKSQKWNLLVVLGAVLGGLISILFLSPETAIELNPNTIAALSEMGFEDAGKDYVPKELFSIDAAFTLKGFSLLAIGGLLIGFGARYAGGCTSGHAISGLSNLQWPSLIAVIGFFIGGMIMTFFIYPVIFS